MSGAQQAIQVSGILFVLVAIAGFVTSGTSMDADPATAPHLLGLFPVNLLHNLVHLALGVWGILAARDPGSARTYGMAAGAIYVLMAVLGSFAPDGFGLVPLGGLDVVLHAAIGLGLIALGAMVRGPSLRAAA